MERERGRDRETDRVRDRQRKGERQTEIICEHDTQVFCILRGTEVTQVEQMNLHRGDIDQGTPDMRVQSPEAA